MQTHYHIHDNTVTLILTDLAPEFHQAAQETGYTLTAQGFIREMLVPPEGRQSALLDQIKVNCQQYMEPLLAQKAGLTPIPWDEALLKLLTLLEGHTVDWWLVGSAALAVRGIAVQPGDLDLVTGDPDALKLQTLLVDYLIQPVQDSTGWVGQWFGRAFIGAKLEWLGGVNDSADADGVSDFGPAAHARLETIPWRGYLLRVPPLELHLEVSLRRGLTERVEQIRRAMGSDRVGFGV